MPAFIPNLTVLYVESATQSAARYAALLGRPPVSASPGFAMFVLEGGAMLGLWTRDGVQPPASEVCGFELVAMQPSEAAVIALRDDWAAAGLTIAQEPTAVEFGFTALAVDGDGVRLRALFDPQAG